jgi:hypothetical protein
VNRIALAAQNKCPASADAGKTLYAGIYTLNCAYGDILPSLFDDKSAASFSRPPKTVTLVSQRPAFSWIDFIGKTTMTLKARVTTEEWTHILRAPFVAGFALRAADPGGLVAVTLESAAMARTLSDVGDRTSASRPRTMMHSPP